ncbi:hypothetical protein NGC32_06275 [Kluyvera cryocrescens]|uniref:hypothetical protein n=1 Tax=Kluyvera cryocrescens TaxID=580 RepID=UPI002DB5A061|nr:hypothetical protein [Kluyvera cryocrescens]MEB7712331.1 hypothetical protein [Kluyvera cryocrescens]
MADIFNDQKFKTELSINSIAPFFANKSASGKVLRRFTGIQWYETKITVNFVGEDQYVFDEWLAEYRYGKPFTFPMYNAINLKYRGKQTSLCNVTAAVPAGAREIPSSILLEKGTKFTFSNQTKIYEVTDSDPATKTMLIFPNLRNSVQAGELMNYRTPVLTLMVTSNDFEQNLKQTTYAEFDATEVL